MTTETQPITEIPPQIKEFQAETKQVLRLVIHSLYSHKEIFLRELISNASDACEKLRFEAIAKPDLMGADSLSVTLTPDSAAGTLSIKDNGIGMSEAEIIDNLGTIARSGTKRFLETLSGDSAKDAQLIGQFGVGFYSAFIVADKVTVLSKRSDAPAVRWDSDGEGQYQIQVSDKTERGTEVILHLRDEDKEFLEPARLRQLVRKYSDHLSIPVILKAGDSAETLNQAKAFWTRPKSELKDEDYQAFYKHLTHDSEEARAWAHNKVEGNIEYTSLLYLPKRAPFDLFEREQKGGIHLYVKRVFIMDKAAELLPPYLRFMRGLVDSSDLPLNVSRELLQNNRTVEKIKSALVKRSLDMLEDLAANNPQEYAEFWKTFGAVLKEGIIDDPGQKVRIAKLLRFNSTADDNDARGAHAPGVTLEAYVSRMKPDQKAIYYLTADSLTAARNSPHLEGFRAKGMEVLLLTDRIDEWVAAHLHDFEGKTLANVASSAADVASAIETPEKAAAESAFKDTLDRLGKNLLGKIASAQVSARLTDSPAVLVAGEFGMSLRMGRILKQAGQNNPFATLPILEVNPNHPLVERLKHTQDDASFSDLAHVLYDQAMLAEGGELDDPAIFVRRVNRLIVEGLSAQPKIILS
ncbi:MAG: molecular chaperone HtpG [Gammaproteobacteria bacterium]|jgi:molecular chaperone HtpG|nr:molecular chaperone HtpG [Gammaproteobacteria bacterium]